MWSNIRALKMKNILIICINSIRRSTGLSKHLEHDMNVLGTFSLTMILGLLKRILLYSQEGLIMIFLYDKFMLMTLSLVLLINHFVMSLARS
jgi:hypothetical protein